MFLQVIQGEVADADQLRSALDRWVVEIAPGSTGWLGTTAGVTANGIFVALARFESTQAARLNSDRPAQTEWWMETSKLFGGTVAFHDCEEVMSYLQGGSDEAGFVQVIQGRIDDAEQLRAGLDRTGAVLAESRPEIIGGTIGLHGDGGFTEAVYFTSEPAAREGERKEMSAELRAEFEQTMSLMRDLTYFDLDDPWLYSPS